MNRKLSDWASIAEIVGAAAIVVSLIFVGLEIRDSARITQAATFQNFVAQETIFLQKLGSDPELTRLYITQLREPESIIESERDQARFLALVAIRNWENFYLQHQSGTLSPEAWEAREPILRNFLQRPFIAVFCNENDLEIISGEFAEYACRVRAEAGL